MTGERTMKDNEFTTGEQNRWMTGEWQMNTTNIQQMNDRWKTMNFT